MSPRPLFGPFLDFLGESNSYSLEKMQISDENETEKTETDMMML
jgi:hypothetical protein